HGARPGTAAGRAHPRDPHREARVRPRPDRRAARGGRRGRGRLVTVRWITPDRIGDWVEDGASVGVGGALFSRLPLALVDALSSAGRRNLHYVSWGGGLPLELLLRVDGVVDRLTFCFSSLDVFGVPPRFLR